MGFTISGSIGKQNYKILVKDAKKGCLDCPFVFCVGSECKDFKKLVFQNKDSVTYMIKDKFKEEWEDDMEIEYTSNNNIYRGKIKNNKLHKVLCFIGGVAAGVIIALLVVANWV